MKTKTELTSVEKSPEVKINGKVKKKAGNRIGYNYIIIKSLKKSQKNDVVKCLYIKSLTNFGFCVIKEGTYGDSRDRQGRDIKDRLIWQQHLHQTLQDKVRMPRLIGHFEENGNYYLVIERIKGKPLYTVLNENSRELRDGLIKGTKIGLTFLDYLQQIIGLLEILHENGVVHRDATTNNFIITPNGKVAIIDMELSYSLQQQAPAPPFTLGTYGYMSPEQLRTDTPTIKEDVFSVGAILLQVWTGISPFKLTDVTFEDLCRKVNFFVPDKIIAEAILQCLHPDPMERPSLKDIVSVLTQYKIDLRAKKLRVVSFQNFYAKDQIVSIIQESIDALSTPLLADAEKGWFSEDMNALPNRDKTKINKAWYASFNRGAAGVLYLLNNAKIAGFDVLSAVPYIEKALLLIEKKYIDRLDQISPGLHFGGSGIAATLALSIKNGLIDRNSRYLDWINGLLQSQNDEMSYIQGITGQGIAHLLSDNILPGNLISNCLQDYFNCLLKNQQKDGSWIYKVIEKTNKPKRRHGFATGIAGIIYFLLEYGERYKNTQALEGAQRGLQWLIKKSIRNGNAVHWCNEEKKELMPWWREGSPGIALAFMKGYTTLEQPIFKKYASDALLKLPPGLIENNLSQYEGLTGLGEIYLEAHRVFNEPQWMERAGWIAQVVMHMVKRHLKFGPYWLVQHERQPTPDFMIGNSGILHFLLRYCHPIKIRFPMLP